MTQLSLEQFLGWVKFPLTLLWQKRYRVLIYKIHTTKKLKKKLSIFKTEF